MVLTRIVLTILLSSVGFMLLMFLGYLIYRQFVFKGHELIYILAQLVSNNIYLLLILLWFVDIAVVVLYHWKKLISYVDVMAEAGKQLVSDDDELIRLPIELKETEGQMNQVKQNALRNARLAKEAEQRKNDLIVYLAHDLKTPLTSVIGYLTLLRDEKQISEELREKYLSVSLDRAERLEYLINEFFEITRFNLSQLTIEPSQINLTLMLEQVVYEFKPLLEAKNLQCALKIAPNIKIKCDANKLERVFDNLMRNAVNYSFENTTIEIEAEQKEDGIYLSFANQGNNISQEKLNRIFEQFYRLDDSRATKTGGSGLGLAIAKKIIELHNGTLTASSENERIEFKIYIPSC